MTRTMVTKRQNDAMTYEVWQGGKRIWHERVVFSQRARNRAGGAAFVEAAHKQEQVCMEGVALTNLEK